MDMTRGCAASVQIWDDKKRGVSDLLFDWSFSPAGLIETSHTQKRRSKLGMESEYEVTIEIK